MASTPKVTIVRPRHVVWGSLWMFLLVSGGVVQTHLRFSERDLEIQTRLAQEDYAALTDERADLEAGVEALRTGEEVRKRAVEHLGLMLPAPTAVHRLEIGEDLWAKYATTGQDLGPDAPPSEPAWHHWLEQTLWIAESGQNPPLE